MAGIASAPLTVIIMAEDPSLHKMYYNMCPDTKLSQVMQLWRDDCKIFGNWSFTSTKYDIEYDINMPLEMLEKIPPNRSAIILNAQLSNRKGASKILVYSEGECLDVSVKPSQKLIDVLWRMTKGPLSFANEGTPLNLKKTVKQTGLTDDSVIYGTRRQIEIKLSTGVTQTIEMDAGSLVYQLIERVNRFETHGEFSLMHRGRHLELYENIKDLKQVVEVTRANFVVSFKCRRVTLATSHSIRFSDFLQLLSVKSQINKQDLEEMKFYCTGCQRCISKCANEDFDQVMMVNCCKERSLSLVAKPACETSDEPELEDKIKFLQRIYSSLLRTTAESSRDDWKKLKSRLEDKGMDYNEVAKWTRELRKIICDYEIKIKALEEGKSQLSEDLESLKDTLKQRNVDLELRRSKNAELEESIMKHAEEIKADKKTIQARNDELKVERAKNADLEARLKNHMETLEASMKKLLDESTASNETIKAKTTNLEANMKKLLDESTANCETINAKAANLEANVANLMEVVAHNFGVKLFVVYHDSQFSPVVSCPELQSRGQCSDDSRHYIRCEVANLRPGWTSFEAVTAAVRPFFTGSVIRTIWQRRGSDDCREVAQVTSLADTEEKWNSDCYCSRDGREIKETEVKNFARQWFHQGGRIFIPGGRRRAVLLIYK